MYVGICTILSVAKSQQRTKVAKVRAAIGISAKEFAALIGKSIHTVKALESGRLALSPELAAGISKRIGVSVFWLLNAEDTEPPLTLAGEELTRENMIYAVSSLSRSKETLRDFPNEAATFLRRVLKDARADEESIVSAIVDVINFLHRIERHIPPEKRAWDDFAVRWHKRLGIMRKSAESAQKPTKTVQGELHSNITPAVLEEARRRLGLSKPLSASDLSIGEFVGETQEQFEEAPKNPPKKASESSRRRS
jgi:transcriptional regulator with XRE-family HTH domain